MVSKIFFSSNLVGRIFFYSSARMFFYYLCAACNFFLPTSACRKFFFKITHPLPQELNGRPLMQNSEKLMKAQGHVPSACIVLRCLEPLMKYKARYFADMTSHTGIKIQCNIANVFSK